MQLETHDVFRMRLHIDLFMPVEQLWTFRVYPDNKEVHIQVEPCEFELEKYLSVPELESELMFQYVAEPPDQVTVAKPPLDGSPGEYICSFGMTKWGHGGYWVVRMRGTLSKELGFRGEFHLLIARDFPVFDAFIESGIHYPITDVTEHTATIAYAPASLAPLSWGSLSFQGILSDFGCDIQNIAMEMTLMPDGSLAGFVFYSAYKNNDSETHPIKGHWTHKSLTIVAEQCEEEEATVEYHLVAKRHGVSGEYLHRPWRDPAWYRQGSQIVIRYPVALTWTGVTRGLWSPANHTQFSDRFRHAVELCLVWAASKDAPSHCPSSVLWRNIFEFCNCDWFAPPVSSVT